MLSFAALLLSGFLWCFLVVQRFLFLFLFFSAKPATKAVVLSIFSVFGRCRSESVVSAVWYLVGVGRPLVCGTTDIVVTTAFFFPFLCDVQLTA